MKRYIVTLVLLLTLATLIVGCAPIEPVIDEGDSTITEDSIGDSTEETEISDSLDDLDDLDELFEEDVDLTELEDLDLE